MKKIFFRGISPWILTLVITLPATSDPMQDMAGMGGMPGNSASNADQENGNQGLTPAQRDEENNLLRHYDDSRSIIKGVYSNGAPKNPQDVNNFEGYLTTREEEREIIKPYLPRGFDFNNEKAANYSEVIGEAIDHLKADAHANPAAQNQALRMLDLAHRSGQYMNSGIMKSPDNNFSNAVMMADPAAHAFMPQSATQKDDNSWVHTSPSPGSYVNRGQDELKSGDNKQALADAEKAASLNPSDSAAFNLKSQAAFALGDYPTAAEAAQTALQINPKDKNALAIYKLSEGRNAREDVSSPLSSQTPPQTGTPQSSSSNGGLASNESVGQSNAVTPTSVPLETSLSFSMGSFRDALAGADAALKSNPRNLAAYLVQAGSYSKMGDYGEALKALQNGLAVDPQNQRLINLKSQVLSRIGHYREALAASDSALERNPRNAESYYGRAMALAGLGDKSGTLAALRFAAKLNPKYQALAAAAENLPTGSDLRLLFSGAQNASAEKSGSLERNFWIQNPDFRWGAGFLLLLILSSMILMGRKSFSKTDSRLPEIEGTASFGPQTAILSANLIAGQYQITKRIGTGGMGIVYEGVDASLGRKVAIKHLREDLQKNPDQMARFLREARLVAALDHPNIVRIYSIAEEKGDVFLVFEFIDGKTLDEWLFSKKTLTAREALAVFKPVASAIDYAHRNGVIHRDIKPSNIMFDKEGRPRVMDFGVARFVEDALLTSQMTRTIVGTPAYMAPETQDGLVRKESDVYSLAICLYEVLCGQVPFSATPTGSLNKLKRVYSKLSSLGFAPSLDPVFNRALDPVPDQRFKTLGEFVAAFEDALAAASPLGGNA